MCIEDSSIFVYVYTENVIVSHKMNQLIRSIGIDVLSTMVYNEMVGTLLTEHGVRPKRRGPVKKVTRKTSTSPSPKLSSPVTSSSSTTPSSPKKVRKGNSIPDDIYLNRTVDSNSKLQNPSGPNSFHAIWSSRDGLWHPAMWVGPIRNITPSKRKSVSQKTINDLMIDQDRTCRLCDTTVFMGTYSNSDVDHIIPLKFGGSCNPTNLQILCVTCHRRKTALECKKVMTLMGDETVDWGSENLYLTNTHVHYEPRVIPRTNPKEFLVNNGYIPGLFVLEY